MSSNKVSSESVSANDTTASIGGQGNDASKFVTKTNTGPDALAAQADHSQEQGLPGAGKKAFSHAKDFTDGAPVNDGPAGDVERLTAGTAAYNRGDGNFKASLEDSVETEETTFSNEVQETAHSKKTQETTHSNKTQETTRSAETQKATQSANTSTGATESASKSTDEAGSDNVSANDKTASTGRQGNDDSSIVNKTNTDPDALASQADLTQDDGLSGAGKNAFSHANDFADGAIVNDGPAGDVERLTADTAASNRGDGNFMASLQKSIDTQEENNSTAI